MMPWPPPGPSATKVSDQLRSRAIDLRSQGVAEVGFGMQPALDAVTELETHGVAVVGADVWTMQTGNHLQAHAAFGWSTNRRGMGEESRRPT